jgi:AraC family ethanolamine operon transcriptional activator
LIRVPLQDAEKFRFALENLRLNFQSQPGAFDSAVVIKTTARKLAETVRDVLKCRLAGTGSTGRNAIPRKQVIRKAMDFVDQHAGEYLLVGDLATALGISERTLRAAFQDYFNVGPVRYLKLRTLHQIRSALKASDPSRTTVTKIAAQFGAWELGRMAQDYRFLFGELPSKTLHSLH